MEPGLSDVTTPVVEVRHISKMFGGVRALQNVELAVGSGEVKLELKDAQSAGQLRPAESEDYKYRYIVMPMRI